MKRMIAFLSALPVIFAACFFGGCEKKVSYRSYSFFSMDTLITLKIDPSFPDWDTVFEKCREITEEVRLLYDADDPDSLLSRFNRGESDGSGLALLSLSETVSEATGGAFFPGLRDVIEGWREAEKSGVLPQKKEGARVPYKAGMRNADLGGIAKGEAEQRVVEYLKDSGVGYGVISFGGNIAVFGTKPDGKPFSVGIRDPYDTSGVICTVSLDSGYVSVSCGYERYYEIDGERYHHIIDPATCFPAEGGLDSVAVITKDADNAGALGDALATAFFVAGESAARELYASGTFDFEAVFISGGEVRSTPGTVAATD